MRKGLSDWRLLLVFIQEGGVFLACFSTRNYECIYVYTYTLQSQTLKYQSTVCSVPSTENSNEQDRQGPCSLRV